MQPKETWPGSFIAKSGSTFLTSRKTTIERQDFTSIMERVRTRVHDCQDHFNTITVFLSRSENRLCCCCCRCCFCRVDVLILLRIVVNAFHRLSLPLLLPPLLHRWPQVREWYVISYKEIRDFPRPITVDQEIKFAELLKVTVIDEAETHATVPPRHR